MPLRVTLLAIVLMMTAVGCVLLSALALLGLTGFGFLYGGLGVGAGLGALSMYALTIITVCAALQFVIARAMLRGSSFGYFGGILLAALQILSGVGSWWGLPLGVYGLWALLTSKEFFRG